jgi:U3 small nucleolar RNA-associated protein 14
MGKNSGIDKDLLAFVSGLDAQDDHQSKVSVSKRNKTVSFAETATGGEQVSIAELTAALDDETGFANLKKRIGDIVSTESGAKGKKVEIVAAPLMSHEQAKLERRAAYDLSAKEVNKWVPVIRANRNAKTLSFPVREPRSIPTASESLVADFQPKTNLENHISELLKKGGMEGEEGIIKAEQMEMSKLTPEEVEKRYQELSKRRALLFFTERKNKRQAKIKSKTFRKIVKKEKERRIVREADASGAQLTEEEIREERMKAELDRIRERMTLKTRKVSKWAHELLQKRKVEAGSREEIMQQVRDKDRLRQEILGKAAQYHDEFGVSDLDSDNAEADIFENDEEEEEEESETENILDGQTKSLKKRESSKKRMADDYVEDSNDDDEDALSSIGDNEVDEIFKQDVPVENPTVGRRIFTPSNPLNKAVEEIKPTKVTHPTLTESIAEMAGESKKGKQKRRNTVEMKKLFLAEDEIDVELDEKTKAQLDMIKRAFAADDVFSTFEAKKQTEVEADRPKDIDLTLPGWGTWGGTGIEVPKGKVILKVKGGIDPSKRKDANLRHVIIHERRNKKVAKLMVEKPPFPFRTREEYEASLGKPVGTEWNSATVHKQKIKPRVQVKVGSIIEPVKFVKRSYAKQ